MIIPPQADLSCWRRQIHQHAETGFLEFWTTAFILEQLQGLDISISLGKDILDKNKILGRPDRETIAQAMKNAVLQGADKKIITGLDGYTGLAVDIYPRKKHSENSFSSKTSSKPSPVTPHIKTLLRFDIDAVAITESTNSQHIPHAQGFSSLNFHACHACGHDGHVAIGIGVVKTLASLQDQLKHGVRILFQPAEEGVRGANAMQHLCRNVQYALIGHIGMNATENHSLVCGTNNFYATKKFDVNFYGKASHAGAEPEKGKNSLLASCNAVLNLHALPRFGEGETRINVGILQAGSGRNVIADKAFFQAEIRGESSKIRDGLMQQAENVIKASAMMYEQEYTINCVGECESARSNESLAELIQETAKTIPYFQQDKIRLKEKGYGSDDACTLMRAVQENGGMASYIMLGSALKAGHHAPDFDFNETILAPACELFVKTVLELDKE